MALLPDPYNIIVDQFLEKDPEKRSNPVDHLLQIRSKAASKNPTIPATVSNEEDTIPVTEKQRERGPGFFLIIAKNIGNAISSGLSGFGSFWMAFFSGIAVISSNLSSAVGNGLASIFLACSKALLLLGTQLGLGFIKITTVLGNNWKKISMLVLFLFSCLIGIQNHQLITEKLSQSYVLLQARIKTFNSSSKEVAISGRNVEDSGSLGLEDRNDNEARKRGLKEENKRYTPNLSPPVSKRPESNDNQAIREQESTGKGEKRDQRNYSNESEKSSSESPTERDKKSSTVITKPSKPSNQENTKEPGSNDDRVTDKDVTGKEKEDLIAKTIDNSESIETDIKSDKEIDENTNSKAEEELPSFVLAVNASKQLIIQNLLRQILNPTRKSMRTPIQKQRRNYHLLC